MQLEPIWHKVGRRTKALVGDLHTLRKLLSYLVAYDCVTFFEYLETLFDYASAQHPAERPHWVLNCSEAVFTLARDRVYVAPRGLEPRSAVRGLTRASRGPSVGGFEMHQRPALRAAIASRASAQRTHPTNPCGHACVGAHRS